MGWASIFTVIGEGLKFINDNVFTSRRRAKKLEEEKLDALRKAKELAHGDDEKALENHIRNLPG
jgi:hypothetical protein